MSVIAVVGAVTAVGLLVAGAPEWAAVLVVAVIAAMAAVRFARRPDGAAPGVVDATGEHLSAGDIVRGAAGFDGPMELTFGWGEVVKVGQGKAHVRFNDNPGQVHPVTARGLRRIS
jgi:hypothetical protein